MHGMLDEHLSDKDFLNDKCITKSNIMKLKREIFALIISSINAMHGNSRTRYERRMVTWCTSVCAYTDIFMAYRCASIIFCSIGTNKMPSH